MTRMLATVAGPGEAALALAGGADVIDLAPGSAPRLAPGSAFDQAAMPLDAVRACVAAVGGRRELSALAGGRGMRAAELAAAARALAACGVRTLRLPVPADAACGLDALRDIAPNLRLVAVLAADAAPDLTLLPRLAEVGFTAAMLDLADAPAHGGKAGRLLEHLDVAALRRFVTACAASRLSSWLAGGLETPDIPRLLVLAPDLLGFQAALPGGEAPLAGTDPARLRAIRALIPPAPPPPGTQPLPAGTPSVREIDYRLLAARAAPPPELADDQTSGGAPSGGAPSSGAAPVDRVFVEEFVLPALVGAYAHERDTPQRLRFAVDAWVGRAAAAADMRDVFSYDLITDGIRMLVAEGHVALVETLAERIAAMVLAHPRVTRVAVRVQKLDTGSGIVGVEIERGGGTAQAVGRQGLGAPGRAATAAPPASATRGATTAGGAETWRQTGRAG